MKESMMLAGATWRKCHDCIHINESSYSVMERKIKSISTISVSNEFGEAWRNIPFNVFYVIRDNLAPHQLVVLRQSILIIFPFCQQCPLFSLSHSIVLPTLWWSGHRRFFSPSSLSEAEEQKPSVFGILMMEKSVFSLKRCHFSNHLMCVRAVSTQVNSNRFGHIYHRAAVLNH